MGSIVFTTVLLLAFGAYFAPSAVALGRQVPHAGSVVVINALLGWTLVGWAVSMAMAARSVPAQLTGWYEAARSSQLPT